MNVLQYIVIYIKCLLEQRFVKHLHQSALVHIDTHVIRNFAKFYMTRWHLNTLRSILGMNFLKLQNYVDLQSSDRKVENCIYFQANFKYKFYVVQIQYVC